MPYITNDELPERVKKILPAHAQDIFRESFNSAWEQYADPSKRRGRASHEEVANKVAWSAVKKDYQKIPSGKWEPKAA